MSLPNIDLKKQYTVKDIMDWEGRWELIDGVPYFSASPSRLHQTVSRRLIAALESYLSGKTCEAFAAPFDVYLSENVDEDYENHKNAVQPDLFVICNPSIIHDRGVKGAPDWIAEIISPSTAKLDRLKKFTCYERFGVLEYWLVSPYEQSVEIYVLGKNGRYQRKGVYGPEDHVTLLDFEDLQIHLLDIFRGFPLSE